MLDHKFGDAADEIVIEEFLDGDELNMLTFSDGMTFKSMPPAQDHKRISMVILDRTRGEWGAMLRLRLQRLK